MRPLRSFAGGRGSSGMRSSTARTRGSSWGPPPAAARPEPARSWRRFAKSFGQRGLGGQLIEVGCLGMCYAEPIVSIAKPGRPLICYGEVTCQRAAELVEAYLLGDDPLPAYALGTLGDGSVAGIPNLLQTPFFKPQVRRTLRNCGLIDPGRIDHYLANDGYCGLARSLELGREEIIEELRRAGLRGRGGAGFPTWRKWQFCQQASADEKYLVCNADEGDPGAFMNRSLLEGDPHCVLEGMLIGGLALGATTGYVYCRAEYPLALERLRGRWPRPKSTACSGRTSSAAVSASTSRSRRARGRSFAVRRRP